MSAWANPMPFWQQLFGQLAVVAFTTIRHYWTYPRVRDVLMTRLFVDETVPDLADLERTSSLFLLSDDYRVFNYQGPKVADVIEVGCIHCVPAGPLPEVHGKFGPFIARFDSVTSLGVRCKEKEKRKRTEPGYQI